MSAAVTSARPQQHPCTHPRSTPIDQRVIKARRRVLKGVEAFKQGEYYSAYRKFSEALKLRKKALGETDPKTASSHRAMGCTLFHLGRYNEALTHLTTAEKTTPEAIDIITYLGYVHVELGHHSTAIIYLSTALNNPSVLDKPLIHLYLGCALYRQALYATAATHFLSALHTFKPKAPLSFKADCYQWYARALYHTGQFSAAVTLFEKALDLFNTKEITVDLSFHICTLFRLGRAYRESGNSTETTRVMNEVLELIESSGLDHFQQIQVEINNSLSIFPGDDELQRQLEEAINAPLAQSLETGTQ